MASLCAPGLDLGVYATQSALGTDRCAKSTQRVYFDNHWA